MKSQNREYRIIDCIRVSAIRYAFSLLVCGSTGCIPFYGVPVPPFQEIRGRIVDADTQLGIADAFVTGSTFTNGAVTVGVRSTLLLMDGMTVDYLTTEDGMFVLEPDDPAFFTGSSPIPDQVEVVVTRGDCERRFMIDINENNVVDVNFYPAGVIELKNPILVPPCQP